MQRVELNNAIWKLALLPAWGGRIAGLSAEGLEVLLPITSESFDPLHWPRAGGYPLFPYSNRIRDARLVFNGIEHRLPAHHAALPHTLHGVSHTRAWQVVSAEADRALIRCDYQGEHWPWAFRAEQEFVLEGHRLRVTLRLVNRGDTPMPAGLGLHPYFQRHPGMRVEYRVGREWQIDADYLATGEFQDAPKTLRIAADNGEAIAHYQSRWDGKLLVDYPQGRLALHSDLTHMVAFAPAGLSYLCLEPVSHLADAFNRPRAEWPEVGTHELAPGETLESTLEFIWQGR